MQKTLLLFGWLLILVLAASPGWSQSLAHDPEAMPPVVPVRVPLRLYRGYLIVVEGSIGSFQKLNLLLDTGANPSVVDQRIAHDLHLEENTATVSLSNQRLRAKSVVLPSLQLGPIRVESFRVLTQDLSFLKKALGCKVDALVGMDVLRKTSFSIDYGSKQILFGPIQDVRVSVPFESEATFITIRMTLQNRPVRLLIDTGDPAVMLFQSLLHDSKGLEDCGTDTGTNLAGQFQRKRVRVSDIALGKEKLNPQIVFIVNDERDSGRDFDGVLGPRGLQFREIAFDFERQQFSWKSERGRHPR
jgi:hypothetical protein